MNADFERRDVVPDGTIFCNSDAECAEAAASGVPFIPLVGELAHALGVRSVLISPGQQCVILSIDQIVVTAFSISGEVFYFNGISDLTFGNYWHGEFHVITSTGRTGGREVCPRAHPGDGVLDHLRVDAAMSLRQRLKARRKMRSGTHLPHPSLGVSRLSSITLKGPMLLTLDGVARGKYAQIECSVDPASAQVVVPMAIAN